MKWICTLKHINTYTYSSAKCTHTHPELWRAPTSTQTSDWINPDLFLPSFNSLTDHTHTRLSASVLHERLTFSVQCKHSINKSLKFGLSPRQQSDTSDSTSILAWTQRLLHKNFLQFYFHSVKWAIPETVGEDGHGQSQTTHFSVNSTQKGQYLNSHTYCLS